MDRSEKKIEGRLKWMGGTDGSKERMYGLNNWKKVMEKYI